MNLEAIGADARVRAAFERFGARGLVLARVAVSQRDRYRLYAEDGELDAEPAGVLWHRAEQAAGMPVVGDWVAARVLENTQAIVEAVLPRATFFSRRAAGKREDQQAIAANIDRVFLVCGLDGDFNIRRLERYLTLAAGSGAEPVIVLNKADLCADLSVCIEAAAAVATGAALVVASAKDAGGLDALRQFAGAGLTIALLGSSGVGKSTIINMLVGEEHFRTQEVRERDQRGQHTTTHRELVVLPGGGALIDTPGMRELQLWAGQESVEAAFNEIAALAERCRFRDCTHTKETGCAVIAAVADGSLAAARFESYHKLKREAARHERGVEYNRWVRSMHRAYRRHKRLNP
jgi:ribosome biogenesis GTPase